MTDIAGHDVRSWLHRVRAVHVVAGAAAAVVTAWAALGLPVAATRGYVQAELREPRLEVLETRADVVDLRLFLIDWTLRQAPLDPQPRALIEADRARLTSTRASLQLRLEQARAAK